MECLFLDFCVLGFRLSGSRQEENVKQTDYELYDVVKEKKQSCIVIDSDITLLFFSVQYFAKYLEIFWTSV